MFGGAGGATQSKPTANLFGSNSATIGTGGSFFNSGAATDRGTVAKSGGLFGAATTSGQNQSSPNPSLFGAPKTDGGLFSQKVDNLDKKNTAIFGGGSGSSGNTGGIFG